MTTQIEPLSKNIIFTFIEDTTSSRFINTAKSGILISSQDGQQSSIPRWGQVVAVGPDVKEVSVDEYILIDQGKWTSGFYVDGKRFWKTDEDCILCVSDEPGTTY